MVIESFDNPFSFTSGLCPFSSVTLFLLTLFLCYIPGADIHAQTEETQETALSLACCGGFQDVAAFLLQAGIVDSLLCHALNQQIAET